MCLPILAVLVVSAIEATNLIHTRQCLKLAAYEAARAAVASHVELGEVEDRCQHVLSERGIQSTTVVIEPQEWQQAEFGSPITVTVTASCRANAHFGGWLLAGRNLDANVTMMKEM
ncbi:MAG: hypothetical protein KDA60_14295 [Planctomycetales bacterium]|nr:hypothetical protein [Planctomycetales bacterium]